MKEPPAARAARPVRDGLSRPLLDLALNHAQITTNLCSKQEWNSYLLPGRTCPDYNYIFVRRGRVVWTVRDEACVLEAGDFAVIPPATWHHASSHGKPVLLGSIHVDVTMPGGTDLFQLLVPGLVRRVDTGSRLDRYLDGFFAEWDRDDTRMRDAVLQSWARLVTLELLYHDAERDLLRQRPIDPLVAALLEELSADPARRRTLADLEAWSGFSAQHINRKFRDVVGLTPLQYLDRIRMDAAARMLSKGRHTVRGVARSLGYTDPYYFSRVFTRRFGRSPSQWREQPVLPDPPTTPTP